MTSRIPARRAGIALALSVIMVGTLAAPVLAGTPDPVDDLETMGEYRPADYAQDAAALPPALVQAVARDLDLAPAEYLAEAAAAFQAVAVVDSLEAAGVDVQGSAMTGTELTVHVTTDADAALVEQVGATPAFDDPAAFDLGSLTPEFATEVYGGEGYYWADSTWGHLCSIGFAGYATATGASQLLTAGHCTEGMEAIVGPIRALNQTAPGLPSGGQIGAAIATPLTSATQFGFGFDTGRMVTNPGVDARAQTAIWGGARSAPRTGTPITVTGQAAAIVGASLCRSGARTGWSCGPVVAVDDLVPVGADCVPGFNEGSTGVECRTVNSIVARVCSIPGDSGGAAMIGNAAVGVISWTTNNSATCLSGSYSGFFPMVSAVAESVESAYGDSWELGVALATPVVTAAPTARAPLPIISGTLARSAPGVRIKVFLDHGTTPVADVPVVDGRWSATLPPVRDGVHFYSVVSSFGELSVSTAATGRFQMGVTSDRIGSGSRYRIGADLARATVGRVASTSVVYLVNENASASVLSSVTAAAAGGGVVILTSGTTLAAELRDELARLRPERIVVVGTTQQVSLTIARQANAVVGAQRVTRLASSDAAVVSRSLLARAWAATTTPVIYVTSGADLSGALAASVAAASIDAPLVTVSPTARTMDALTLAAIARLKPAEIRVVGALHSALLAQLKRVAPVTPLATAGGVSIDVAVNAQAFVSADRVFVTTRVGLAAALGAAPAAGAAASPIYTIGNTCVPEAVLDELVRLGASHVTLIGAGTRSPDLLTWPRCP